MKKSIELTEEQRSHLEGTISSGKIDAHIIQYAHILLKIDRGTHGPKWSYKRIKEAFGVHTTTIWRVRRRFLTQGLDDALSRQKQLERPEKKKVTGRQEAQLITLACMEAPTGSARWSIRLLRKKVVDLEIVEEVGRETVRLVLQKKRIEAMAQESLLHSRRRKRGIRVSHGRCLRCLPSPL
jgi:transposase